MRFHDPARSQVLAILWVRKGGQNANDENRNHQFNKCKSALSFFHVLPFAKVHHNARGHRALPSL
jgi:hypothetical protein